MNSCQDKCCYGTRGREKSFRSIEWGGVAVPIYGGALWLMEVLLVDPMQKGDLMDRIRFHFQWRRDRFYANYNIQYQNKQLAACLLVVVVEV